ncbi:MAG: dCTP deaminase [Candidatus Ornithomonoglobus sp.]
MILTYSQILKRVNEPNEFTSVYEKNKTKQLIEPFYQGSLQGASYDVHISNCIIKQKNGNNIVHLSEKDEVDNMFEEDDITNGYLLKPGEYILVRLVEKINMPDDLVAHIRPRTTLTKLGVIVFAQHINPSFSGNLYLGVKNFSNSIIELKPNVAIAQCVFETINATIPPEHLYRNKKDSKYQNESDFISSKVYDEETVSRGNELVKFMFGVE